MTTTAQILTRAAAIIGERGHTQGTYIDQHGRVCAIGAIRVATAEAAGVTGATLQVAAAGQLNLADWDTAASAAGHDAVDAAQRTAAESILVWNDRPGRTTHEVQALLRRAAKETT